MGNLATGSTAVPHRWRPWVYVGLVGIVVLASWLAALAARTSLPAADPDRDAPSVRESLASEVRERWRREAHARHLIGPRSLTLQWAPTRLAVVPDLGELLAEPAIRGSRAELRRRGDTDALAAAFRSLPRRQAVVVGPPGSGKTAMAIMLTLDLLADRRADDPVPVLLPLSSWNPRVEDILGWITRRLTEDHPAIAVGSPQALADLVTAGQVLPVLDGFDELPEYLHDPAMDQLDDALDGRPFVLTCRTTEYDRVVTRRRQALAAAAVVEVQPVDPHQARSYLLAGSTVDPARWEPLVRSLTTDPTGPVATALSTPLLLGLVRSLYGSADRDPAELCDRRRFPTVDAVERHLFGELLVRAYDAPRPGAAPGGRAVAWHGFLAAHLERLGSPEIAWWRLPETFPGPLAVLLGVANTIALTLPLAVRWLITGESPGTAVFAAVFGAATMTASAMAVLIEARALPGPGRLPRTLRIGPGGGLSRQLGSGLRIGLPIGLVTAYALVGPAVWSGSVTAVTAVAAITGVSVLGFGLALDGQAAAELEGVLDPPTLLRLDRTNRCTAALAVGVLTTTPVALLVDPSFGLAAGAAVAASSVLNSTYGRFGLVRLWLAARGRLPFALLTFLADAQGRGILRTAGPVYEFRHDRLRQFLADGCPPYRQP